MSYNYTVCNDDDNDMTAEAIESSGRNDGTYVASVYINAYTSEPILNWCIANGGKHMHIYKKSPDSDTPIIIENAFIDFYDEELFILFRMTW